MEVYNDLYFPEDIWRLILTELPFTFIKKFILVSKFINKLFYQSVLYIDKRYLYNLESHTEFKKYINLTNLDLSPNYYKIDDNCVSRLLKLTQINLFGNDVITNHGISKLTNLTKINLRSDKNITDDGIKRLTNLLHINMSKNYKITDYSLTNLTNLKSLSFEHSNISDNSFTKLINLTMIHIGNGNTNITDNGFKKLASYNNLQKLSLGCNNISNKAIKEFYSLTSLNVKTNINIDDNGIKNLTNLTELGINRQMSSQCIRNLRLLSNIF